MGALFAGSECVIEKTRARHDAYNSVYAGELIGVEEEKNQLYDIQQSVYRDCVPRLQLSVRKMSHMSSRN